MAALCYVSRAAARKPTQGLENSNAVHLFQIYMQLDKSKTNSFQAGISHSYGSPLVWDPAPESLTQQHFSCFSFFLFSFFQLKNFFPTESLNTLPTRLEEFWAPCLGKGLSRMLGLFRENTFHHGRQVSHWIKTKTLEKIITLEKDFEQFGGPVEVNREMQQ